MPRKKPADKEIETLVPRQTLRRQRAEPAEANPGSAFTRTLAEEIAPP